LFWQPYLRQQRWHGLPLSLDLQHQGAWWLQESLLCVQGIKQIWLGQGSQQFYTNCINQTSSHLFHAVVAAKNRLVCGSDMYNAFAKAPPPKQGVYIRPNRAFTEWWKNYKSWPPIPLGHVIPVLSAMQDHPESPRLWEKHTNAILRNIGLMPMVHKPCLYSGIINKKWIIFKCQVDDFTIATPNECTAHILLDMLGKKLTMPIKWQGLLDMFNGVDVTQIKHYIKIDCPTHVNKLCAKYLDSWLHIVQTTANWPTPLPTDSTWLKKFNAAVGPNNPQAQCKLEALMQINYHGGIGKLIWAMTTCRPNLAYTAVKLSQSNTRPAEHHYHGLKHAIQYLYVTRLDSNYF
jgi:hypothetical protein